VALSAVAAGGPAVPGTVAAAQNAVLNLINGDPVLASALAANPLPAASASKRCRWAMTARQR